MQCNRLGKKEFAKANSFFFVCQALEYLNSGYEWVIDIDIEQFFDKVNHDKLIQILRDQVNDSSVLNFIRKYLRAGVME